MKSTDNGDNWININNGLTTNDIAALTTNSLDHIFAATNNGVYRSTDNGDHWAQINNGLTYTFTISIAVNSADHIFVGTFEGG